ncbi:MAG: SoxR reducing system RseC family protein [Candidatus Cryptobacteroides sp.]
MVDEEIRHSGKIVEITPSTIVVEIIAEEACGSCSAASLCGMSEVKKKLIEVPAVLGYEAGEEVWVLLKSSKGMKAVWLSYIVPLILLMATILILSGIEVSELICGLGSIGVIAVYYLLLFLFRNKVKKEYTFYIEKK